MAPWMVIAGLIGAGFVVLIIAPTIHRTINARSRAAAEASRIARANELRSSADGAVREFADAASALRVRDRLLLRGVRAEAVPSGTGTSLIFHASDEETLDSVMRELGIG